MRRNSSTSSSRRQAKRWALLLGLVLLGLLLVDATLVWYTQYRVSAEAYTEEVSAKAKHMRLRLAGKRADIIFVGSSRTLYHVSTADFERAGWTVYNYGLSGHQIASYPSMVEAAARLKPATIAIGVTITSFDDDAIEVPSSPSLTDLRALAATGQSPRLLAATAGAWLGSLHALNYYSEIINLRVRPVFERLDRPLAPQSAPPGGGAPGQAAVAAAPGEVCDCKTFGLRPHRKARIYKCTNGDAILFGNFGLEPSDEAFVWKGFHAPYLALLNHCLDLARAQGVRPVVYLEPRHAFKGDYDLAAIRAAIHAPVLDFTRLELPDAMWANSEHLNDAGRHVFSAALAEAFAALPAP